jgi:replication fork protection complex subunit Csm3/Swi3
MFPKGDFASTIHRVETVCKTRRVEVSRQCTSIVLTRLRLFAEFQSAFKGYRDAFYPPPPSPTPPPRAHSPGFSVDGDDADAEAAAAEAEVQRHDQPRVDELAPSEITRTPGVRGAEPLFDDPDEEEMRAMEEMEREEGRQARAAQSASEPEDVDDWDDLYA